MFKGAIDYLDDSGQVSIDSVDMKIELNPKTLAVEIWEINPLGADLISDGSDVGTLSKDLGRIEAVWTDAGCNARAI